MKVFLATKNKGKIVDFKELTEDMDIEVLTILDDIEIPDVEENGTTFEENSQKKAREIAEYTGIVTVSDDSGLCVDYLNGEPGLYSARYAGEDANDETNMDKLLEKLKDVKKEDRTARFVSVVSIAYPDGRVKSFRGEVEGEITFERRGTNGFGYNPIFFSYELQKTFGEATSEEKNSISHRARAFNLLKEELMK